MSPLQLKGKRKLPRKTSDDDRISNLPDNAAQKILECLPLKDAAKTSILSRRWRYKWVSTSKLVLDETFIRSLFHGNLATSDDSNNELSLAYSKAINKILFSHVGPILKFVLCLPKWFSKEADMISHWIQYVYAKGVKELTLESKSGMIDIPSCLFSCVALTHFTLICDHLHIPPTFQGFPCLVSLKLILDDVEDTEVFENLILKCPKVEKLILGKLFYEALGYCGLSRPEKFAKELEHLRVLQLLDIDLDCNQCLFVLLSLLRNSPNIEQLYVSAEFDGELNSDAALIDGSCNLQHLRYIQLTNINGLRNELLLIKFLLASSPAMKKLGIKLDRSLVRNKEKYKFAKELLRYSRASPDADIILKE